MRNRENELFHKGRKAFIFTGTTAKQAVVQNVTKSTVTLHAYPSPFAKNDGRYLTENGLMANAYRLAVTKEQIAEAKSKLTSGVAV